MDSSGRKMTVRERVAAYRARMREQGFRPVQIWVPDTRDPDFRSEAARQARAVVESSFEREDQAFIDEISTPDGE